VAGDACSPVRRPISSQDHQAQTCANKKKGHETQQQGSVDVIGAREIMVGHGVNFPVLWLTNSKKKHRFRCLV
jgi:hypothetical protein